MAKVMNPLFNHQQQQQRSSTGAMEYDSDGAPMLFSGNAWSYVGSEKSPNGNGFFSKAKYPVSSNLDIQNASLNNARICHRSASDPERTKAHDTPFFELSDKAVFIKTDASSLHTGDVEIKIDTDAGSSNGIGNQGYIVGPNGAPPRDFTYGNGQLVNATNGQLATAQQNVDALAAVFGKPDRDVPVGPYDNYPRENYDLPKHYQGIQDYGSQVMIALILYEEIWQMTECLPWKKHNGGKIKLDIWHFDDSISTRTPYETTSRLVTSRVETMESETVRWGGSHISERTFWLTATGRQHWSLQQQQLKNGVLVSQMLNVIIELLTCHAAKDTLEERYALMYESCVADEIMAKELYMWDMIKREPYGLDLVADEILRILKNRKVKTSPESLMIIIPEGVARFTALSPEHLNYMITGKARETFDDYQNLRVRGFGKVRVQPAIVVSSKGNPIEPLNAMRTIGGRTAFMTHECKTIRMHDYRTSDMDHQSYFDGSNKRETMAFAEMWRNNGLYTSEGLLTDDIGCPTFFNYELCEKQLSALHDHELARNVIPPQRPARGAAGGHWLRRYVAPSTNSHYKNLYNELANHPRLADVVKAHITAEDNKNAASGEKYGEPKLIDWIHTAGSYLHQYVPNASERQTVFDAFHRLSPEGRETFAKTVLFNTADGRMEVHEIFGDGNEKNNEHARTRDSHTGYYGSFNESTLARALALATLRTDDFVKFCINYNIPVWGNGFAASPHRTYRTAAVIGMIYGSSTGNTFVGPSDYTVSQQSSTKMVSGSLAFHSRAWVHTNKHVVIINNAVVTGYAGGHTNRYWEYTATDHDTYVAGKRLHKSLFAFYLPPDFRVYDRERFEINGSLVSGGNTQQPECTEKELWSRENGGRADLSHPLAELYDAYWHFAGPVDSSYQFYNPTQQRPAKTNGLCYSDFQINVQQEGHKFTEYTINAGHFGPNVDTGARAWRGGMGRYEKPAYLQGGSFTMRC